MANPFGHVDMRVTSMKDAEPFYAVFLGELGFTQAYPGEEWMVWAAEGELPSAAYVAITEDPTHVPNANRIAFWAADREKVDRVATMVQALGATITSGPQDFPEYAGGGTYYALYLEDPAGNKLEVVYRMM
jgi:catechol 2,3-dioxygenase-like lactoylglutathione lyase family enzyme